MVYVTGDMHGEWGRFKAKELRNFGAADTLIVCGDFGFIWDGSRRERSVLRKMAALPYTVAFVDGCHENFELLEQYPKMKWKGGSVIMTTVPTRSIGGVRNVPHSRRSPQPSTGSRCRATTLTMSSRTNRLHPSKIVLASTHGNGWRYMHFLMT